MTIIRVIDFETTGMEPPEAEVCEVGFCDVDIAAKRVARWQSWLCAVKTMPPEVRAIHHISLAECTPFAPFNPALMFDGEPAQFGAMAAHNADFETRFFEPPLPVICTYKVALRVWPEAPSHSNGALRYWLEDAGKIAPEDAMTHPSHRAGPDAYVTAHILLALFNEGISGKQMIAWTKEPRLLPTCPIGKFKGKPWPKVEAGLLGWMLKQPTMEEDLKWNARREIARREQEARA